MLWSGARLSQCLSIKVYKWVPATSKQGNKGSISCKEVKFKTFYLPAENYSQNPALLVLWFNGLKNERKLHAEKKNVYEKENISPDHVS